MGVGRRGGRPRHARGRRFPRLPAPLARGWRHPARNRGPSGLHPDVRGGGGPGGHPARRRPRPDHRGIGGGSRHDPRAGPRARYRGRGGERGADHGCRRTRGGCRPEPARAPRARRGRGDQRQRPDARYADRGVRSARARRLDHLAVPVARLDRPQGLAGRLRRVARS
jgi:hypothetical protein